MTDDEYLVRLLRLLDDEPSKPTRVDLIRAITEARRRRRARRIAGAGGAVALTVAVIAAVPVTLQVVRPGAVPADRPAGSAAAAPAPSSDPAASGRPLTGPLVPGSARPADSRNLTRVAPPTTCVIERLPIPGGVPKSLVTGADPTGRFILGRSYPTNDGTYPILIWDNGRATRVDLPGADQSLTDATTAGVAVGAGWADQGPLPYLVRDGRATRLAGDGTAQARAINEAGQIVGTRDGRQPVIWPDADAKPVDLPLPGPGWRGEAMDIDEDGTVVGVVVGDDGRTEQGYLWLPDGSGRPLPNPTIDGQPARVFRPQSVRHGWVTGLAGAENLVGDAGVTAVRLRLATGEFVGLPSSKVWPQHGNGQGWVAGSTPDGRAALLTDGGELALPELDNHRQSTANIGWRVSDDGRTVSGQSDNAKGDPQAVRWRCR